MVNTSSQNQSNQTPQSAPPIPPSQHNEMGISPRTLFLIFALAAIAVFFFIIAVYTKPTQKIATNVPTPTPIVAKTVLSLESAVPGTQAARMKGGTINVMIDSNSNPVTAVQMELSFDPKVLTNISLASGTFFKSPVELIKKIDPNDGRISYALGIQPQDKGVVGKGLVATITYSLLPTTDALTSIMFLPKTIVTAQGINQSVLKNSIGLSIQLKPENIGTISPTTPVFVSPTP